MTNSANRKPKSNYYRWLVAVRKFDNKFYRHGANWHYEISALSKKLAANFFAGRKKLSRIKPNNHLQKQWALHQKPYDLPF